MAPGGWIPASAVTQAARCWLFVSDQGAGLWEGASSPRGGGHCSVLPGVSQMSAPRKAGKRQGRQCRFTSQGRHVLSGKRVDKEANRGVRKGNLEGSGSWEWGGRNQRN